MLHAFATDDFLQAVEGFDRHARRGRRQAAGISCRKGASPRGRVERYDALGSASAAVAVCQDLWARTGRAQGAVEPLVAVFDGPSIQGPRQFESLLWQQLQTMHGVDAPCFDWADLPGDDPTQALFCIGGQPWRVRGLADASWPCIIFEPSMR